MNADAKTREAELTEAIRQGDVEALGEYLQLKERPLMAFIHKSLGAKLKQATEAEDIFQEMASSAVKALGAVDLSERDPFNWLCQQADRRLKDKARHVNSGKRDPANVRPLHGGGESSEAGFIDMLVASVTSPSAAFRRNSREAKLAEALAELPEDQQEAIRMRYVQNLPSKEIAAALGKSDAATRVMLSRIIGKLKSMLDAESME